MIAPGGEGHRLTLDDLAALNREMAALVRAGLPLESGLKEVARDFSRGTGRLASALAEQASAGKSLPEALAACDAEMPPIYRAVVAAGIKSGRLSAALEGFAETAARVSELRHIAAQAAIYPLLVVSAAWMMMVFVAATVIPRYGQLELNSRMWAPSLNLGQPWLLALACGIPAVVLILALVGWRRTGRATALGSGGGMLQWLPGVKRAVSLSNQANFAELLQLLIGCRVSLEEALPLAARASDARIIQPAERLSAGLIAGQSLASQLEDLRRLPSLVRMALAAELSEQNLLAALRSASRTYRERAAGWISELAVMLPVGLTLAVGGAVALVYAGLLMQPYFALLQELLSWSN